MSKAFIAYQEVGGQDEWVTAFKETDLSSILPAFITILSCDKILNKQSSKEVVESAKYLGPLYFDLDNEADITGVIQDANKLVAKLMDLGLTPTDMEIFLTGKKGLHITVPEQVFMEKPGYVSRLFTIYKEMAFKLATQSTDFAVYSGRAGRMFRTTHRQRDNGNWKVRITPEELKTLTPEGYAARCATKTGPTTLAPVYRPKLALIYEGMLQKVSSQKRVKSKPVDAATLSRHRPTVTKVMRGEKLREGVGFNKVAIQLGLYAHEAKLSEDDFVGQCQGLIEKHAGDGWRYNTPQKREAELRRMFDYLEDGVGYDYAIGPIQALLEPAAKSSAKEDFAEAQDEPGEPEEVLALDDSSGIFVRGANYLVATEQGEKHIMDAKFVNAVILRSIETEQIACIAADIQTSTRTQAINLERGDFVSSTSLHRAVSSFGAAFTGTDVHARNIYTYMLREVQLNGKTVYVTEKEGLDVLKMPLSIIPEAREPFVVWSDAFGVRLPPRMVELGLDVRFVGYPTSEGVLRTDLANAPLFPEWSREEANRLKLLNAVRNLLKCQDAGSLAKVVGWMVATFYAQLFKAAYGKFPLLHVNGAAGSGKSELIKNMMHLFYHKGDPHIISPSSTNFAIATAIAGSASIPVIVDEYKPHEMNSQRLNDLRSLFRSSYNSHTQSRGGGSRSKDSFGALNQVKLTGPVAFIAEVLETEVALIDRSVVVSLRRPPGLRGMRYKPFWLRFVRDKDCLCVIGQHIAASVIQDYTVDRLRSEFDRSYQKAVGVYLPSEDDPSEEEAPDREVLMRKSRARDRIVYGHAVAEFGLGKFKEAMLLMYPAEAEEVRALLKPLEEAIYSTMDDASEHTKAEYIKVLIAMSDLSQLPNENPIGLAHGVDFELSAAGGSNMIAIVGRTAYNKYRQYCKSIGMNPLFNGDASFLHAMKGSHIYARAGTGTAKLIQETMVLDYDELLKMGVPAFNTR